MVEFDRDPLRIPDLGDHIPERCLVELEVLDRIVERVVDPLFGAAWISEVDRLVLLAEPGDLLPPGSARVDDRRFVRERDRGDVSKMEHVHEATLGFAADADVLGVVVEDAGDERRGDTDLAGRHRHATVGVQRRSLFGDLLGNDPLCLGELVGRLLVADTNPLLDESVVAFRELLDAILTTPQFAVEPGPFLGDGMIAIGHQGPLGPLAGTDDRITDRDLDLTAEAVAGRRVQILRRQHLPLELLEIDAGPVRIDSAGLTSVPQPDSHFLFCLLGADFLHPCKVGQLALLLAGAEIAPCRGSTIRERSVNLGQPFPSEPDRSIVARGRKSSSLRSIDLLAPRLLGLFLLEQPLLGRGEHHPSIDVVGIFAERGIGQTHRRAVRSGPLGLSCHLHQRRGLAADDVPCHVETFTAERRQIDAVGLASVAVELLDISILGDRRRSGDRDLCLALPHRAFAARRCLEHKVEPGALEATLDKEHGVAVGTERREVAREHAEPRVRRLG